MVAGKVHTSMPENTKYTLVHKHTHQRNTCPWHPTSSTHYFLRSLQYPGSGGKGDVEVGGF